MSKIESIRTDSTRIAKDIFINNRNNTFVAIRDIFLESIDLESIDAKAIKTIIFNLKAFFIYNSEKILESTTK